MPSASDERLPVVERVAAALHRLHAALDQIEPGLGDGLLTLALQIGEAAVGAGRHVEERTGRRSTDGRRAASSGLTGGPPAKSVANFARRVETKFRMAVRVDADVAGEGRDQGFHPVDLGEKGRLVPGRVEEQLHALLIALGASVGRA